MEKFSDDYLGAHNRQFDLCIIEAADKCRELLISTAKDLFGHNFKDFPKMRFKNSHGDLVDCLGIEVPSLVKDALPTNDLFSDLSDEALDYQNTLIMLPSGLWVYKMAYTEVEKESGKHALPWHYVLFGKTTFNEMFRIAKRRNSGMVSI